MNTTTVDPFLEGAIRVFRAHTRDGLAELSHSLVLAGGAGYAALKLWRPDDVAAFSTPLLLVLLALTFLPRHVTDRIRQRIAPSRTGYVGQGSFHAVHLLYVAGMATLAVAAALLIRWLLGAGGFLLVPSLFLDGIQILKGSYASVTRLVVLGALSILFAGALVFTGWGFLYTFFVWAASRSVVYLLLGAGLLTSYLR